MLVESSQYPFIDFETLRQHFESLQDKLPPEQRIKKAHLEICFIAASGGKSIRSGLNRSQLLEFIIRFAQSYIKEVHKSSATGAFLGQFFELFIYPVTDNSSVLEKRTSIRKSAKLNELLHDNLKALERAFEEGKLPLEDDRGQVIIPPIGPPAFSLKSAIEFFNAVAKHGGLP